MLRQVLAVPYVALFGFLTVGALLLAIRFAIGRKWKEAGGCLFIAFAMLTGTAQGLDLFSGKSSTPDYDAPRLR